MAERDKKRRRVTKIPDPNKRLPLLPNEMWWDIGVRILPENLTLMNEFCRRSKLFSNICRSSAFWKQRFKYWFPRGRLRVGESWKSGVIRYSICRHITKANSVREMVQWAVRNPHSIVLRFQSTNPIGERKNFFYEGIPYAYVEVENGKVRWWLKYRHEDERGVIDSGNVLRADVTWSRENGYNMNKSFPWQYQVYGQNARELCGSGTVNRY